MDLQELIISRRSIRKFIDKKVSEEQINQMLKAAMYAPSAVNKRPWHFVVIRDKHIFEQIMEVHPNAWMLAKANLAILVVADPEAAHDEGYWQQDCAAATQNILLSAHGMGIGTCWLGIYPRQNRVKGLRKFLGIPEGLVPFSLVAVGYTREEKKLPERFDPEKIHYEKW